MPTRKIDEIKRCGNCGKLIASYNKSGLCQNCFRAKYVAEKKTK